MFNLLKSRKTRGYSGNETYKFIDELLNDDGKSLRIVSPYIGISYARKLLKLAKRKKIYILTSGDDKKKDEDAVKLLLGSSGKLNLKLLFLFLIAEGMLFYLKFYLYGAIVLALLVFGLYLETVRKVGIPNLHVKIATTKFIHEKIYISHNKAIVGSANMTWSGTHKNIEHIEIIKDLGRVRELSQHFDKLWGNY